MNLLSLFRGRRKPKTGLDDNPYLNARRSLNEYNGAIIGSRRIWQAVALICLMIAVGAVGGVIHFAGRSRFIPYVVEVDTLGQAVAVKRADRVSPVDARVVQAFLAAFVRDVRTVSFDRGAQNDAIWRAYAMLQSGDPATTKITEFMRDPITNPAKRAEEASVGVEVLSVLRQTEETWEIDWVETIWNRQGVREGRNRMRGILTMYIVPPTSATTEEEIRMNPLGLYVRDFTWARIAE